MVEIFKETNRYGYTIIYELLDNLIIIKAFGILTYQFGNNYIDPDGGPFITENFKIPYEGKNYVITKILNYVSKRLENHKCDLTIFCEYKVENKVK
jgi:hypothetical protein